VKRNSARLFAVWVLNIKCERSSANGRVTYVTETPMRERIETLLNFYLEKTLSITKNESDGFFCAL